MRVRWLRKALHNLDEEAAYIATDDAAAARLVVERILATVAQLARQPGLGRPGRVAGTRELIVQKTRYIRPLSCARRNGRNSEGVPHISSPSAALVNSQSSRGIVLSNVIGYGLPQEPLLRSRA